MLSKISNFKKKNNNHGFTMIEILVVLGIIGLLSVGAMVAVNNAKEKAKVTRAKGEIDVLYKAMSQLFLDTGEWPGHQTPENVNTGGSNEVWDFNDADAGILTDDGGLYIGWNGPYLQEIPTDPWSNNYFFDTDYSVNSDQEPCDGGGRCFMVAAVGSFGPNGGTQNLYDSDDIIKIVY